jgi:hypothetical protein
MMDRETLQALFVYLDSQFGLALRPEHGREIQRILAAPASSPRVETETAECVCGSVYFLAEAGKPETARCGKCGGTPPPADRITIAYTKPASPSPEPAQDYCKRCGGTGRVLMVETQTSETWGDCPDCKPEPAQDGARETMLGYLRARMTEPDWKGGIKPLQAEITRLQSLLAQAEQERDNYRDHANDMFKKLDGAYDRAADAESRAETAEAESLAPAARLATALSPDTP